MEPEVTPLLVDVWRAELPPLWARLGDRANAIPQDVVWIRAGRGSGLLFTDYSARALFVIVCFLVLYLLMMFRFVQGVLGGEALRPAVEGFLVLQSMLVMPALWAWLAFRSARRAGSVAELAGRHGIFLRPDGMLIRSGDRYSLLPRERINHIEARRTLLGALSVRLHWGGEQPVSTTVLGDARILHAWRASDG